jgi:hypothetical protein
MKTCKHFERINGEYTSYVICKKNHKYICTRCLHEFTANDFRNLNDFCNLANIYSNEDNVNTYEYVLKPELQNKFHMLPKPVSFEDHTI